MRKSILNSEIRERRKKRMIVPVIYLILEMVFIWLVLSLIQLKFDFREWAIWSMVIFIIWGVYAFSKTWDVYNRQKNYKE
jgi:L-asparagine transporter-like permease